jgi:hypothetical protein
MFAVSYYLEGSKHGLQVFDVTDFHFLEINYFVTPKSVPGKYYPNCISKNKFAIKDISITKNYQFNGSITIT